MGAPRKSTRRPTGVAEPSTAPKTGLFVYGLCLMAVIGGFLFGYDTGIVSGAMLYLPKVEGMMPMSSLWKELIVSLTPGMAVVGALTAGPASDRYGRKVVILCSSFVFTVGGIVCAAAPEKITLLVGRILLGFSIGFASMIVPIYVGETSPANIRGTLGTAFQLMITFGLMCANLFAGAFSYIDATVIGWRLMFAFASVPALFQFIGFFFLPESPRFLFSIGKEKEARDVLSKIYAGNAEWIIYELEEIRAADIEEKKAKEMIGDTLVIMRIMQTPHVRKALIIGCTLQLFQQFGGVNTIVYYTSSIIKAAGISDDHLTIWISLGISSVNFIATFLPIFTIDKLGRRILLLVSVAGVIVALVLMGTAFVLINKDAPGVIPWATTPDFDTSTDPGEHCRALGNCDFCVTSSHCGFCGDPNDAKAPGYCLPIDPLNHEVALTGSCTGAFNSSVYVWEPEFCVTKYTVMPIIVMIIYLAFFSIGYAPLAWVLNSEFYPLWARSTGCAFATACNWIGNLIISLTFLTLTEAVTKYGAFYIYAGITVFGLIFVFFFIPETKGLPIEQVELLFMSESERVKIAEAAQRRITSEVMERKRTAASMNNDTKAETSSSHSSEHKHSGLDNAAFVDPKRDEIASTP